MKDLLMLGNPLVGNPIAALHIRALPMTSRLGWGSSMPVPIVYTRGKMMSAATVWEINVATTRIKQENTTRIA